MSVECRVCSRWLGVGDYDSEEGAFRCPNDGVYSGYGKGNKPKK